MHRATIILAALTLALLACGGGSSDTDAAIDADPNAPDADPNAPDADPNAPDADPSAPDAAVQITCGDDVCDPATQECCVNAGEGSMCVDIDTCGGVVFECDQESDCTVEGETCCAMAGGTSCVEATSCQQPTCTTADDCPNADHECCDVGNAMICAEICPGGP